MFPTVLVCNYIQIDSCQKKNSSYGGHDHVPCKPPTTGSAIDQGPQLLCSNSLPYLHRGLTSHQLLLASNRKAEHYRKAKGGCSWEAQASSYGRLWLDYSLTTLSELSQSEGLHPVVSLLWVSLASCPEAFPAFPDSLPISSHVFNPILVSDFQRPWTKLSWIWP